MMKYGAALSISKGGNSQRARRTSVCHASAAPSRVPSAQAKIDVVPSRATVHGRAAPITSETRFG
jgi:hypothetical protein